jgi:cell division protein ZipA
MDNLRWILLALGVVLIAGLYLWEQAARRGRRKLPANLADEGGDGLRIVPRPEEDADYSAAFADLNALLREDRRARRDAAQPTGPITPVGTTTAGSEATRTAAVPGYERLIIIHVKPPAGLSFGGARLLPLLKGAGLRYGPMRIFHYHGGDASAASAPWFSVANLREPGVLSPDELPKQNLSGLTMFQYLPSPVEPVEAFDAMIRTARHIALQLGGALYTSDHQPLTHARIADLRAELERAAQ